MSNSIAGLGNRFSRHGILFVVSAPSGGGKSTLCAGLRQTPDFIYSVSCTTRLPRAGEIEGEDYHFISVDEFIKKRDADAFLEYADVHGNYYGTLRDSILENLRAGVDVLVDIDIQGAKQIRSCKDPLIQAALADVFIMPPSMEELKHRLMKRGTETEDQLERRLTNAKREMQSWSDYRYFIISASIEEDLQKFRAIMKAERYRSRRYDEMKEL